ncbi:hypothetical protein [Paracidovorax konjaci]|uniref:Uncharacterized protein n=1 Tax=Paracidovorax konjaci TaxID=32040 RepID=A0A1I1ULN0_9BURK|nr:hypothetical protein [Paracidovorax konjaci]SFD71667.1 hypothetical protein SAMN04489710_105135 [Paracidovorax konjaci]
MTMYTQHSLLSGMGRLLLGACTLSLALLVAGCGGSGGSGNAVGSAAACGSPDTHCAPRP